MKVPCTHLICCRRMKSCIHPSLKIRNYGTGDFCLMNWSSWKETFLWSQNAFNLDLFLDLPYWVAVQTLVFIQGRKWQGLGGGKDKNGLLGWLRNALVLFFVCDVLLGSDWHFHTADMLESHTVCTLWDLFLALVMQALWIFKAASPHPCDRSKRNSWTLKFGGERKGIVLLYSEGQLWQWSLRAEYM